MDYSWRKFEEPGQPLFWRTWAGVITLEVRKQGSGFYLAKALINGGEVGRQPMSYLEGAQRMAFELAMSYVESQQQSLQDLGESLGYRKPS